DHVVTRDLVLAGAHQRQFDLVLDVFDVQGAARRHAPLEGGGDLLGQARDRVVDARAGGGGATLDREKRLGDGDRDLVIGVGHHAAVALDHPQQPGGGGGQFQAVVAGVGRQRLLGVAGGFGVHAWAP